MTNENMAAEPVEATENPEYAHLSGARDFTFSDGLALGVVAGRDVQFSDAAAGGVVAGQNLHFSDGAACTMVIGANATISDGIVGSAIIGGQANLQNSFCGVLLSGNTQLGEGSRVLLNTPQALAMGAAFGVVFALLSWLLRKK